MSEQVKINSAQVAELFNIIKSLRKENKSLKEQLEHEKADKAAQIGFMKIALGDALEKGDGVCICRKNSELPELTINENCMGNIIISLKGGKSDWNNW